MASAANARRAAQDSTAIGFIGDLDSGATRVSLPITNQAEIPQISPGAIARDMTAERYRPSDHQTFARVIPDAAVLERAAGVLEGRLGLSAQQVATGPRPAAPRDCRDGGSVRYLISPYREPSQLGSGGGAFVRAYRRSFGAPLPAAAYGFEATSLMLSAIRRAGSDAGDRDSVGGEVLGTHDRRSPIGEYSIESSGDTTLDIVTAYSIHGCRIAFSSEIRVPRG